MTDHPWLDRKSNKGGSRSFSDYDCFKYSIEDFKEKARNMRIDQKKTTNTGVISYMSGCKRML